MTEDQAVDWIQLEFFGRLGGGHYRMRYKPSGRIDYTGGDFMDEDQPSLSGRRWWMACPHLYQNLAALLRSRPWEDESHPGEDAIILDGWGRTLSWRIDGITHRYDVEVDLGPKSILKVMRRLENLLDRQVKQESLK